MKIFTIFTNLQQKTNRCHARFVALLSLLLTVSSGNVWGTSYIAYEDDTQKASTTISSSNVSSGSAGNISWSGNSCTYSDSRVNIAANGYITFSVTSGNVITKIVIVSGSSSSYYGTWTSTAGSVSSSSGTTNVTGINAASVKVTTSTAFRCTSASSIKIYYTSSSCSGAPSVGSSLTSVSVTVNSITATVPISTIGGCDITENGIVYSTSNSTPTVGGSGCTKVTTTACGSTAADKEVIITGLTCGQSYYVRGFATNAGGTSYTNVTTQSTSACPVDNYIDDVHSSTGYSSASPHQETGTYTTPRIADKTIATSGTCEQLHYHFVGWITAAKYEAGTSIAVGDLQTPTSASNATYYAVWAKQAAGGGTVTDVINRALVVGANSNIGSNGNSDWATCTVTGSNSSAQYFIRSMGLNGSNNYAIRWNSNGYLYCSSAPTSGLKLKSITVKTTSNKSVNLFASTSTYNAAATATSLGSLAATSSGVTYSLTSAQLANNYTCVGINGSASSTEVVSISIEYSNISYTDYIANCCTELASISGSVNITTNPTEAVVSWNNIANVASWTLQKKASGDADFSNVWANKVVGTDTDVIEVYSDGGTNNKCRTTVSLSSGTTYIFKLIANPTSGSCPADQTLDNGGSGYSTGEWTVTWSVNGSTTTEQVADGAKVAALPTAPTSSDCDDAKEFVGWRATAIDGVSVSDPGSIFTTVGGSPTITDNITFYAVFADKDDGDAITLTFPDDNNANNHVQDYESTWTAKVGTFEFSIENFNNNNWGNSWAYIRCGRKNNASIGTITTGSDIDFQVDSVLVKIDNITADKVNSAKLQISAASTFATKTEMDITQSAATQRMAIASPATNKYYRIVFDCASHTSNGIVQISEVTFKQAVAYSNYVTSCASCDADATYTSSTPTVSDINCTGATLTMEDGLATVGAAGCNISDYGFVIGTADNPTVGGVGVTKLQVGTSNPTIGADFSSNATGLTKGTRYYIRAYATNHHGTAYSSSTNFWTKDVSSIAITTAPTKTNYIVGETFDATGMVVTATMASSATEDVTSDVTYSTDALTSGANQDFAINYTLCETNKSVNQKINVYTLSVSEGTNPTYGSYSLEGAVITVTTEAQKTFSLATTNAETRDNGDGSYTIINPTGNVTVVINYRNAVQVKVYYRVDGTEVTGLTQDVYESSQTTLPTASALSSAMSAQGMALPDEAYPNFIGWSETEFSAQTEDPTIVEGTPVITTSKSFYAVYSNVEKIRIDESDITSTSYPGSEQTLTKSSKDFKYHYICKNSTYYLQFKKNSTNFGYIYNNTAISNIAKIEIGASGDNDFVPVYAGSAANTISGSALTDEDISKYKYVYLFPASTQYFIIKGDNSYTYKVDYIDIFYASSTVYYMTQFCTRYAVTGASTSGTAVLVNGNTGGTLTSSHNELCEGKSLTLSAAVNAQYNFGEWKIVKTGVEPEVDLTATLLGANKTSLTPPAFSMPAYGITVSATISEKTATAWSWTYNSAAIPDPVILYVGEVKQLDVTYTPDATQLVSAQKNYTVTKESSPVAEAGKAMNYYKMRGAAGVTEETNATVTFSLNSLVQEVNVTVKPLPSARFEDNVHNAISTTLTATVTDGVVSLTKKTPTHADVSDPGAVGHNSCERQHLHLVGWIDGDWEPYINYINGGSRPSDSDIITATGYFFLPNADIDLSAKDGHTYYAVWGQVTEWYSF